MVFVAGVTVALVKWGVTAAVVFAAVVFAAVVFVAGVTVALVKWRVTVVPPPQLRG